MTIVVVHSTHNFEAGTSACDLRSLACTCRELREIVAGSGAWRVMCGRLGLGGRDLQLPFYGIRNQSDAWREAYCRVAPRDPERCGIGRSDSDLDMKDSEGGEGGRRWVPSKFCCSPDCVSVCGRGRSGSGGRPRKILAMLIAVVENRGASFQVERPWNGCTSWIRAGYLAEAVCAAPRVGFNSGSFSVVRVVLRVGDFVMLRRLSESYWNANHGIGVQNESDIGGGCFWLHVKYDYQRLRPLRENSSILQYNDTRFQEDSDCRALFERAVNNVLAGSEKHPELGCVVATVSGEDDQRFRGKDVMSSWKQHQALPGVLQPCHSVIFDPQPGQILEALDTVNMWYASIITDVAWPMIKIHYEGWSKELWDEWINVYVYAHRLRRFDATTANFGHQVPKSSWQECAPCKFIVWAEYLCSQWFHPKYWARAGFIMTLPKQPTQTEYLAEVLEPTRGWFPAVIKPSGTSGYVSVHFHQSLGITVWLHVASDSYRLRPLTQAPESLPLQMQSLPKAQFTFN
ncbi:hypothetical protein Pelo_3934 [Pelomyxa schiedti]|nr:hypothetical protein Pelo_3934 [Pelomyxa schiedti]